MPLTVSFDIPPEILTALINGTLIRRGGVIQDSSGRVAMCLRSLDAANFTLEAQGVEIQIPSSESLPDLSTISFNNFAAITKQFNKIDKTLNLGTAASLLNLSISAMGFAVIVQRIEGLEQKLEKTQQLLQQINSKMEMGFTANFRAALDLAINAFTMSKPENRRDSALSAINRFLETEHIYTSLLDKVFEQTGEIVEDYLLMLCLSYISESRCYLELGEFDTAIKRLHWGKEIITSRMEKYIDFLLTSNSLVYLHPGLKEEITLSRLTQIYRWKNPEFDESSVFQLLRDKLIFDANSWDNLIDNWIKSLSTSILAGKQTDDKKGFWGGVMSIPGSVIGGSKEARAEAIKRLAKMMELMESMIETHQRFVAYELGSKQFLG